MHCQEPGHVLMVQCSNCIHSESNYHTHESNYLCRLTTQCRLCWVTTGFDPYFKNIPTDIRNWDEPLLLSSPALLFSAGCCFVLLVLSIRQDFFPQHSVKEGALDDIIVFVLGTYSTWNILECNLVSFYFINMLRCERMCVVSHTYNVCLYMAAYNEIMCMYVSVDLHKRSTAPVCGSLRGQRGQLWKAGGLGVRKLNMKCKQTPAWTFSTFTF